MSDAGAFTVFVCWVSLAVMTFFSVAFIGNSSSLHNVNYSSSHFKRCMTLAKIIASGRPFWIPIGLLVIFLVPYSSWILGTLQICLGVRDYCILGLNEAHAQSHRSLWSSHCVGFSSPSGRCDAKDFAASENITAKVNTIHFNRWTLMVRGE